VPCGPCGMFLRTHHYVYGTRWIPKGADMRPKAPRPFFLALSFGQKDATIAAARIKSGSSSVNRASMRSIKT
jgi:hypothetical protein